MTLPQRSTIATDLVSQAPIVVVADLGFTYAGASEPALRGIDLTVDRGELVGLVGLNGAGKTTLGLCLDGIVPHLLPGVRTGRVLVGGRDPGTTDVREMASTVGVVFDDSESGIGQATVADEVAIGLESLAVDPTDMPARIEAALGLVGLAGFEGRDPTALSGGQQQRLAIAAVLAMRPTVLFLDEPTSNLDPEGRDEVFETARRLTRTEGLAVIVAEHDVDVLARYADRIVVLSDGQIVADGTPGSVFGQVAALTGLGLRVPQVTEFAQRLSDGEDGLPLSVEDARSWLERRR